MNLVNDDYSWVPEARELLEPLTEKDKQRLFRCQVPHGLWEATRGVH